MTPGTPAFEGAVRRRAAQLCYHAEPHDTRLCAVLHESEARRQFMATWLGDTDPAAASAALVHGSAVVDRAAHGAAGLRAGSVALPGPAAPNPNEHRPGVITPEPAEWATAIAQKQV